MLGELWNASVSDSVEITFVNELTKRLVDTESIWAPIASLHCSAHLVSTLCSKGLIERNNNQLRFSHQTIQEYAVARLFAESDVSLSDFVIKHQETVFQRPTIWAVLNYLRENAPGKYQQELDAILNKNPRVHVRFLLVSFMCRQHDPNPHEIALIGQLLNDEETRLRVLTGISARAAWFEALKHSHFPTIMSDPEIEQWPLLFVLSNAWEFDWDSTFELVQQHWATDGRFDTMTLRVMAHCGKWNEEVLALAERVMTRVKRNHGYYYQNERLVGVISSEEPEAGARLAARIISTEAADQPDSRSRRDSPLEQRRGWRSLEGIAKAAPFVFLEEITPWLVWTTDEYHKEYESSVLDHYVGICMALNDRDYPRESPILTATQTCIEIASKQDAPAFTRLFESCWDTENAVVHRLFIEGLMNVVAECSDDVFEYLMGDNRRFTVGEHGDTQNSQSTKLIRLLFPHLQDDQRAQLIERILRWTKYKSGVELCEDQLIWDRESRLHLLTAIPTESLMSSTAELIEQEKSELQNWDSEILRAHSGWVKTIPPITGEEMETAADDDLIEAFSKPKPEHTAWSRVEGGFEEQGGAEASGDELAKLADSDPERAVAIIRMLISNGLNKHVGRALQGLSSCSDRELVLALVKDISNDCDESEEFRSNASRLVRAHCDDDGLPEEITELLESWLAKPWDHTRSVVVDGDMGDWKPEESFLWTDSGLVILDTDNSYFTLLALTQCLLSKNNPQGDRWLRALLAHLEHEVSFKTWRMFCGSLHFVRAECCSPELGKALVSKLFEKFPELASATLGCRLLARLGSFLDAEFLKGILQRLITSNCPFDQQAAGELLTLFALLDSTTEWASPLLDAQFSGNERGASPDAAFLVGSTHAAANLWHDLNKPGKCAEILGQLMYCGDVNVADATRALFWNEMGLPANNETAAIIKAMTERIDIVSGGLAEDVLAQLTDILPHLRPEILRFCKRLVEKRFDELRRREFNAYEVGQYLVEISMTLQRFDDTRSEGLDLFETLLRAGLDEADKALKDVDAVDEAGPQSPRMPRRRR